MRREIAVGAGTTSKQQRSSLGRSLTKVTVEGREPAQKRPASWHVDRAAEQ